MEAANETFTPHIKSTVTSETVVPPSPVPYQVDKVSELQHQSAGVVQNCLKMKNMQPSTTKPTIGCQNIFGNPANKQVSNQ